MSRAADLGRPAARAATRTLAPTAVLVVVAASGAFCVFTATGARPWLALVAALLAGAVTAAIPRALPEGIRSARPFRSGLALQAARHLPAAALSAVMLWGLANVLLSPRLLDATYGPAATSAYSPAAVVLLLGLILAATVALALLPAPLPRTLPRWTRPLLIALGIAGVLVVQLTIARSTARIPTSDTQVVLSAAYRVVDPSAPPILDPGWVEYYFSLYPNNLSLAALMTGVLTVGTWFGATTPAQYVQVALAFNCLVLTATATLTVAVVHRVLGTRAAVFALLPTTAFLVLSPWINVPYTDSLCAPFPILLLTLGLLIARESRRRRYALWAGFAATAALGCSLKPTVVFAAVALAGAALLIAVRREPTSRGVARELVAVGLLVASVCAATAALVLLAITTSHVVGFSPLANQNAMPFSHFMDMGTVGGGGYNEEDVIRSRSLPAEIRGAVDLQIYFDRVRAMGAGGYVLFLGRKLLFILGDGAFWQGWDGFDGIVAFRNGPFDVAVQQWYLVSGATHGDLGTLWQACWLLMLVLLAVPGGRSRLPFVFRTALRVAVLMLLGFLLLGEARSRYLYLYVPVLIVLASTTLPTLATSARSLARRVLLALRLEQESSARTD